MKKLVVGTVIVLAVMAVFASYYFYIGAQFYGAGMQLEQEGRYEDAAGEYWKASFSNQAPIAREAVARCHYLWAEELVDSRKYAEAVECYKTVVDSYSRTSYASNDYAVAVCSEIIRHGDLNTRENASIVIAKACKSDVDELLPYLSDEKTVTVYYALIMIGEVRSVDALVNALDKFGYKRMALDYLNSGNVKLEDAAERWADRHGYEVVTTTGAPRVVWGGGLR